MASRSNARVGALALALLGFIIFGISHSAAAMNVPIVNGIVPQSYWPEVQRFIGTFSIQDDSLWSPTQGTVTISLDNQGHLRIYSTTDITGRNCGTSIGAPTSLGIYPGLFGGKDPIEVKFSINKGRCTWIAGNNITLHYNEAFTGVDVYEIELLLKRGYFMGGRTHGQQTKTWILKRVH